MKNFILLFYLSNESIFKDDHKDMFVWITISFRSTEDDFDVYLKSAKVKWKTNLHVFIKCLIFKLRIKLQMRLERCFKTKIYR